MVERPQAVLQGIEILHTLLGAQETIIGIELNKPDAIATLRGMHPRRPRSASAPLRVKYPQGDSKMLIRSLLGIEVPAGLHAADLGHHHEQRQHDGRHRRLLRHRHALHRPHG